MVKTFIPPGFVTYNPLFVEMRNHRCVNAFSITGSLFLRPRSILQQGLLALLGIPSKASKTPAIAYK